MTPRSALSFESHFPKIFVLLLFATVALAWPGPAWAPPVPPLRCKYDHDGTKLHYNVVLPHHQGGSFESIIMRNPHPPGDAKIENQPIAVSNVAVITQYIRGNAPSEGKKQLLGKIKDDTPKTMEWLQAHPWFNGKLFSIGEFLLGTASFLTAESVPCLYGQMIWFSSPDLYNMLFHQGIFRQDLSKYILFSRNTDQLKDISNPSLSSDPYWTPRRANQYEKVKAPTIFLTGWFSPFTQDMLDAFEAYRTRAAPKQRAWHKLIIGPWVYGSSNKERIETEKQGELTFPKSATKIVYADLEKFILDWSATRVKGLIKDLDNKLAPINYFLMGPSEENAPGNRWVLTHQWPPPSTPTPMYLHNDGSLQKTPPTEENASKTYPFDPQHPTPTVGGRHVLTDPGPRDQKTIETRPDVLSFTTETLKEPLYVVGRIRAKLWVSSDAKDTDFSVKLTDVYPDGRSIAILDGITRLRHHKSTAKEDLITPNTPTQIDIDLWTTALVFNKGHKIRLLVTSSDSPAYLPNPNTGAPFSFQLKDPKIAKNTLHFDKNHASQLTLPIVAPNVFDQPYKPIPPQESGLVDGGNTCIYETKTGGTCMYELSNPDASSPDTPERTKTDTPPQRDTQEKPKESNHDETTPKSGCKCNAGGPTELSLLLLLCLFSIRRPHPSQPE